MTTGIATQLKCCACGSELTDELPTCTRCGSGKLLDRRRYIRRVVAVSIMVMAVALLVGAMVYGELHRAASAVAIGM